MYSLVVFLKYCLHLFQQNIIMIIGKRRFWAFWDVFGENCWIKSRLSIIKGYLIGWWLSAELAWIISMLLLFFYLSAIATNVLAALAALTILAHCILWNLIKHVFFLLFDAIVATIFIHYCFGHFIIYLSIVLVVMFFLVLTP